MAKDFGESTQKMQKSWIKNSGLHAHSEARKEERKKHAPFLLYSKRSFIDSDKFKFSIKINDFSNSN